MNRRQLIQSISILGGAAMLAPKQLFASTTNNKTLHYVGIGDGGCKLIEYLLSKGEQIDYTVINSSFESYHFPVGKQILVNSPKEAYIGRNINLNLLNTTSGQLPSAITNGFSDKNNHYVLLASLGGFTGSYYSKAIATYLQVNKLTYNSIISLPFTHEGLKKRQQAMLIKNSLQNQPNTVFVDYDKIRQTHGNFKLKEAFSIADEFSLEALQKFKVKL